MKMKRSIRLIIVRMADIRFCVCNGVCIWAGLSFVCQHFAHR